MNPVLVFHEKKWEKPCNVKAHQFLRAENGSVYACSMLELITLLVLNYCTQILRNERVMASIVLILLQLCVCIHCLLDILSVLCVNSKACTELNDFRNEFLARLDEVQEELLYYPRRWHWR